MSDILTRPPEAGRGCGFRDEEMPYLCTGLSSDGMPMEHFITDPTLPYDDIWQRGYALVELDGIWHVLIFVSGETYPSPWDFFSEAKRYGTSRKMPQNFPFHMLTPGESKMYFLHRKAIPNFAYRIKGPVYGNDPDLSAAYCVRLHGCHWKPSPELCEAEKLPPEQPSKFWPVLEVPTGYHPPESAEKCTFALKGLSYLIHKGGKHEGYTFSETGDRFEVNGPSFGYAGFVPQVTSEVAWQTGCFLATYISHIEYANKPDDASAQRAQDSGFDVKVVPW